VSSAGSAYDQINIVPFLKKRPRCRVIFHAHVSQNCTIEVGRRIS
jgi:hypothetical protein